MVGARKRAASESSADMPLAPDPERKSTPTRTHVSRSSPRRSDVDVACGFNRGDNGPKGLVRCVYASELIDSDSSLGGGAPGVECPFAWRLGPWLCPEWELPRGVTTVEIACLKMSCSW